QPYFQGLDVTEDETPPPGVVSSWALSRARHISATLWKAELDGKQTWHHTGKVRQHVYMSFSICSLTFILTI
ncbi:hypothetical protein P3386_24535, partial [Vibrio parahaemolyticus]|nr:hypothetical protein [Vibrio parahaemolyticus]